MALRQSSKINTAFSMSSMTDIIFLLLLFFMITSTLIAPNALKLMLPESNNQTAEKAITTVSITADLKYYVNINGKLTRVSFAEIESALQRSIGDQPEPYIALHADKTVPFDEVVKIMNIARRNQFKLIVATAPEK
ncbi:MAG: biopolymer transporter ExbD [Bacteroidales bacterium]|jgi:biopolymer transport protein ExbD|nr:biopolymer transporter ExbD [Bacteroidales bacterium]